MPPQEPAPQSNTPRVPIPHFYRLFITILLLLVIVTAGYKSISKDINSHTTNHQYTGFFALKEVLPPKNTVLVGQQPVTFVFNQDIDAETIGNFIDITPAIEGAFRQVGGKNSITFFPSKNYPTGAALTFTISDELKSIYGNTFQFKYPISYSVEVEKSEFLLSAQSVAAKFMSFPVDTGIRVTPKFGSSISDPQVKLFKATTTDLLQNLIYEPSQYGFQFTSAAFDTRNLSQIFESNKLKNDEDIVYAAKPGLYYLVAYDGKTELNSVWVTVNTIGVHLRQDDQKVVLAAQNLITGEPENNLDIKFYKLEKSITLLNRYNHSSIASYNLSYPESIDLIVGTKGQETLVIPINIPNTQADINVRKNLATSYEGFIYTDRPIYKPGDTVQFHGIVRTDNDAQYELPSKLTTIKIVSSEPKLSLNQVVPIAANGTFSGSFTLPANTEPSDYYTIFAQTDPNSEWWQGFPSTFTVAKYHKPEFDISVQTTKTEYDRGETITGQIAGKFFNSQSFSNQEVTYTVYEKPYYETEKSVYNSSFAVSSWGGMCGAGVGESEYGEPLESPQKILVDKDGTYTLNFPTNKLKSQYSSELTIVAQKTDTSGNTIVGAQKVIVHQGQFNIYFRPTLQKSQTNEPIDILFYAEDRNGQKLANKEFSYRITDRTYADGKQNDQQLKTGTVTTNESGLGRFTYTHPGSQNDYTYLEFEVSANDQLNNKVFAQKYVYLYTAPNQIVRGDYSPILSIISPTNNLTPNTSATLEIQSPKDMVVFTTFDRGRVYDPQWLFLKAGLNTYTFPVNLSYMPSITPSFSYFLNGEYHFEGLQLNVPAMSKVINVTISTDKPSYKPGETALLSVTTTDANNNLISADISLQVVDKAIYALKKNANQPLHSSFYYARSRQTNSSSSLTWIGTYIWGGGGGYGGGGGMDAIFNRDVDTLYWNPDIKTGTDGRATIQLPLPNQLTTWTIQAYASDQNSNFGQSLFDFEVKP